MPQFPKFASDDQHGKAQNCLFSACTTAKDLTPIYLCDSPRCPGKIGRPCMLYYEVNCKRHEVFPERFDT